MSPTDPQLSAGAVRLALAALEAPLPRLSAAVMKRRSADTTLLSKAGVLKPGGHKPVITASDDFSDVPLALTWDRGCFGYFSAVSGWHEVSHDDVTPYDIDVTALMAALTKNCSLTGKQEELVPSHLWHLGLVRLDSSTKRMPLLLGRRLANSEVWGEVEHVLRNRSPRDHKIIITSTDAKRIPRVSLLCTFVSMQDVLDTTLHRIDPIALSMRFGHQHLADSEEPIRLLADGKTVIFLGTTYHLVKGIRQRELIRLLYEYFLKGEHPVSSAKLLEDLNVGDHTRIRDLFNKSAVWGKVLMERHGMCGFCLPGVFDEHK